MNKRECWNCKNSEFYELKNGWLKCKKCRKKMSLTNGTYIDNLKIPLDKLKKLIEIVCDNPNISVRKIGEITLVAYNTGYKKKRLISATMVETKSRNPTIILERLLSTVSFDDKKIEPLITTKKNFTDEQIIEIRKLNKEGVKGITLARKFNADPSNMYKIIKGELYKL